MQRLAATRSLVNERARHPLATRPNTHTKPINYYFLSSPFPDLQSLSSFPFPPPLPPPLPLPAWPFSSPLPPFPFLPWSLSFSLPPLFPPLPPSSFPPPFPP